MFNVEFDEPSGAQSPRLLCDQRIASLSYDVVADRPLAAAERRTGAPNLLSLIT